MTARQAKENPRGRGDMPPRPAGGPPAPNGVTTPVERESTAPDQVCATCGSGDVDLVVEDDPSVGSHAYCAVHRPGNR